MSETIICEAVELATEELRNAFRSDPTLFFTENDVVCTYHALLTQKLHDRNLSAIGGRDGKYSLVHCEYPTPFRCSMAGHKFERKTKSKYRRGHFDLVVFDPRFASNLTFDELKGQNLQLLESDVLPKLNGLPAITYGIEFYYSRDPVRSEAGVAWAAKLIHQDAMKLREAQRYPHNGFVKNALLLAFFKGTADAWKNRIKKKIGKDKIVSLVFADA